MTDVDSKKIEELLKNIIKPLKETVEVLKSKVDHQEFYLVTTSSIVKSIKEQQSVANEKLDTLWDQTVRLTGDMEEVKESVNRLEGRVGQIDDKLDRVVDTNIDYGNRIKDIEQIPVIAHDLKLKSHKRS